MEIAPFETEQFFARYEFSTRHQLCNSDCESVSIGELLELAGIGMEELACLRLGYTEPAGNPELRSQIAAGYTGVTADEVLVLGSPVEGIYLAARSLLEPGDEVVVLTPAYDALVNLFEHVAGGSCVKRWPFRPTAKGWLLDLAELRSLLSHRTRLVVVNFPHNPTGHLPSQGWLDELSALADQRGFWLFCDEMYHGLVHSGTAAVASLADRTERAIVLSGLSKTHGLPGLRCGWLVARDVQLRERLLNWKFYTSICPPAPSEFLAAAALRVADTLRQRSIARIEANLALAAEFFARWPERFEWRPPLAGSTALVGFDVPSVSALAPVLARDAGLLIQSAAMLGGDDRHMRLGFGRAGFPQALGIFDDWLAQRDSG